MNQHHKISRTHRSRPRLLPLSLSGAMAVTALAQDAGRVDKLENENKELRKRLEALEDVAKKEGILSSGESPKYVKALSSTTLTGFVTSSYFYNTGKPGDRVSDGYLWNNRDNQFTINKVKLTLASPPVERSGDKWDAAYRVSLIYGEDANSVNTGGLTQGFNELREAYVELNAPVGTGLNIKVGQLISLLNYESGDGGAANNNFSQGFQWYYTGNGPSTGAQVGYNVTDWLDVKLRVQNGLYAGPSDANNPKTFIGSIGVKPCKDLWVNFLGFYGHETIPGNPVTSGASILAGYQLCENFGIGFEGDYFNFDTGATSADLWSVGCFLNYDFVPTFGVALRGEYLKDPDKGGLLGIPVGGRAGSALSASPETDGDLASLALTLNWKPLPCLKIQPEARYDTTSYSQALDGKSHRFLLGAGLTYLF